jgi:lon-related putative ATP-dependent protease
MRRVCDPASFAFETTAELPKLAEVLGQPRAVDALEFGAGILSHGFNLFALGLPGSGKTTLIREHLERRAAGQPIPPDLCYVHNFVDGRRPLKLQLPAGQATQLQQHMAALVRELQDAIPRAFESKEYTDQRDHILHKLEEDRRATLEHLEAHVTKFGFQLIKTPSGLLLTPVMDGAIITEEDLGKLTEEQRIKLVQLRERLGHDIEAGLRQVRELEKGTRDALHALEAETASFATRHLMEDLRAQYQGVDTVLHYLDAVQSDVVENADLFSKGHEKEAAAQPIPGLPPAEDHPFTRYEVNVLVDNRGLSGAPVVLESNPTYHNLVGRIEHRSVWGGVSTNFTLIKPGALHRANGGYLIIPAREVLLNAFAWEGLKRSLKDRAVRVEELGTQLSLLSTITLEPEPVPLNIKVVLIGSPLLYYLLYAYDEDFQKLFKVKADFTAEMDRSPEAEQAYALFVGTSARLAGALPFDRGAVARVVEYGSRAAGDQAKLTTRFGEIADVVHEAAHRAAQAGRSVVAAEDVRAAEDARRFRANLLEERQQEEIARGTLLIQTTGTAVGRVNGLAVLSLGDFAFGHPARITATAGPGQRGVVSIEREVDLSGPIHGKGVLILSGYLLQQYGAATPLSLSASLVFEQSYGLVEGDSASLAELCALLSTLAGRPLRQDLAVTGSVDQYGHVQSVGGVSEKVEGFFDACRRRGLTGSQGVLIPAGNRANLMLRDEVVAATQAGQFGVWVVATVDEALELLTGRPAGIVGRRGRYPQGSLHRAAADRLAAFARTLAGQDRKAKRARR